jgi:hypothetical protein
MFEGLPHQTDGIGYVSSVLDPEFYVAIGPTAE